MKKVSIAITAAIFASAPSVAAAPDWWMVSGGPGESSVQFVDAASIQKASSSVSFDVATYWSNGRQMERQLTMRCDEKPTNATYADMWKFACGSDKIRMSSGLKLGPTEPEWLAKTMFSMPA